MRISTGWWFSRTTGCLLLIIGLASLVAAEQSTGKSKAKSKSSGTIKSLDTRVEKLETNMLREIVEISNQYEEVGQHARAKALLEVLLKLNPNFPGLKEKVEQLNEKVFDAEEIEYILDVGRTWTPIQAVAVKSRPVRVEVQGDYQFQYTTDLTADGITAMDAGQEYVEGIPCGGLMAVVVNNGKPTKAVHLKSKMQWVPSEDGIVMLKINAPAGHKSTGKLTIKLSGLKPVE